MDNSFEYQSMEIRELNSHIQWKQTRWIPSTQWKQHGKEVILTYTHPKAMLSGVTVEVHYEIYDHLPMLCKWITVKNKGSQALRIDHFTSEIIAHPEKNNYVDEPSKVKEAIDQCKETGYEMVIPNGDSGDRPPIFTKSLDQEASI